MINTVILQGRLTNDAETQATPNGVSVCHFRLAVQDGRNGNTQFFNCTAWRGTADTIGMYCQKGREIIVQGSLNVNRYQGRDGNNRERYEVNVDKFYFTADKGKNNSDMVVSNFNITNDTDTQTDDEPLPF